MAKWNFFKTGNSLIKELVVTDGDVNPRSESFMQPTLDLQGDKIVFKESGQYKTAIMFTEIGTINNQIPSSLQDAYNKIIVII